MENRAVGCLSVDRPSYQLKLCVWEITLACCFSCRYCGSGGGRARAGELSTEEAFAVADQLGELGCERVSLIGGEVFMRPDWAAICRRLRERGMRVNLITNGFLFTEKILDALQDAGVESVSVSLDGPEAVHDRYRQPGSFARAIKAIEALCARGIPTSVISTLNAENAECLEAFYRTLRGYPLYAWQLQACSPMGNAARGGVPWEFSFAKAIGFVRSKLRTAPFAVGIADNIGYFTPDDGLLRGDPEGKSPFGGCQAGLSALGIDSVGNVRGCESMYDERFIEANLREKSLREIWENPDGFAYNRAFRPELLSGACASCEWGAYCAGGCRSYDYFTGGRLYENGSCARAAQEKRSS